MIPGEHIVILCDPTGVDRAGFAARRLGLEVRDCFSIQTVAGPLMGLLIRCPFNSTVLEQVVREGAGAIDIDSARISTEDSLGGGGLNPHSRGVAQHEGYRRPWMDDPQKRKAFSEGVKQSVAKAESLGRFPANLLLVHGPDCECIGTKVGSGPDGGYSYTSSEYQVKGFVPSCKPASLSNRGTEEVADWNCQPGCPVRLLDMQSGQSNSGPFQPVDSSNWKSKPFDDGRGWNSHNMHGSGQNAPQGYGDTGGASRFFYNATSLDDLTNYLLNLTGCAPIQRQI